MVEHVTVAPQYTQSSLDFTSFIPLKLRFFLQSDSLVCIYWTYSWDSNESAQYGEEHKMKWGKWREHKQTKKKTNHCELTFFSHTQQKQQTENLAG